MTLRILSFLLITLFSLNKAMATKVTPRFDHNHKKWTLLLKHYASQSETNSTVNYKLWSKSPQSLEFYLKDLSAISQTYFDRWSKDQQKAFLINAYNAFTIKLILFHYPVKSIKDIGGLFTKPWNIKFFTLLGEKRTLHWIKHEILRNKFKDPQIHFVVHCASISGPQLILEAYTADNLVEQLKEQKSLFLKDASKNYIDKEHKAVYLSKIFKWNANDFKLQGASVLKYVISELESDPELQSQILKESWAIKYTDYNWGLNSTPLHEGQNP